MVKRYQAALRARYLVSCHQRALSNLGSERYSGRSCSLHCALCGSPLVAPRLTIGRLAPGIGQNTMKRFKTKLVPGNKAPYSTWTFLIIPEAVQREWNQARFNVRGTINGNAFRGSVAKGEGVHRMPVKRELLKQMGVARGKVVDVAMELDTEPRTVQLPDELKALFRADKSLASLFDAMAPSHRRAWAAYIGEAKRPETRARRAQKAPAGIRARLFPNQ